MGGITSRPKVAVIGAGMWGRNIVRIFKELEGEGVVRLKAVVDAREDVAEEVASSWNVPKYFSNIDELMGEDIDAVAIAVPVEYLAKVARRFIAEGIHTFVEKPVALDCSAIRELLNLATTNGVVVQPGFLVRYDPVTRKFKELISEGNPLYLLFKRLSARPPHRRGVSVVYDLMIHDIDLVNYMFGRKPFSVLSAVCVEMAGGVPQSVQATVVYGGVPITFVADGILPIKIREIEAYLRGLSLRADFMGGAVSKVFRDYKVTYSVRGEEPLKAELRDFIKRVRGLQALNAPTLEDALAACEIADAVSSVLEHV